MARVLVGPRRRGPLSRENREEDGVSFAYSTRDSTIRREESELAYPKISASFFAVASGQCSLCVRIAYFSASCALAWVSLATRGMASSRIACAVAVFFVSHWITISTVTWSWSGCQQS